MPVILLNRFGLLGSTSEDVDANGFFSYLARLLKNKHADEGLNRHQKLTLYRNSAGERILIRL